VRPLLALLVALQPSLALACAACARDQGRGAWLLVAGLLATPFVVAAAVAVGLRRAGVRP
jgi:hypothetical protein